MVDRLAEYQAPGIDDVIVTANFGQKQGETLAMMERFAAEVIPQFTGKWKAACG